MKFDAPDELWVAIYIIRRTALDMQVSDSVIITTNTYLIETLSRVTSSLVDRRSHWAPGPGRHLWYRH
jgi:hypothetical protein